MASRKGLWGLRQSSPHIPHPHHSVQLPREGPGIFVTDFGGCRRYPIQVVKEVWIDLFRSISTRPASHTRVGSKAEKTLPPPSTLPNSPLPFAKCSCPAPEGSAKKSQIAVRVESKYESPPPQVGPPFSREGSEDRKRAEARDKAPFADSLRRRKKRAQQARPKKKRKGSWRGNGREWGWRTRLDSVKMQTSHPRQPQIWGPGRNLKGARPGLM